MIDEKKLLEKLEELKFANEERGYDTAKDVIQEIINLVDEQPKTDWIPCEERLPSEESEEYLVYKANNIFMFLEWTKKGWNTYKHFDGTYYAENEIKDVVAWQPLPQPYKKEGAENDR